MTAVGALPRILPGLTSVTFRKLSTDEIIAAASEAGLSGIEWGGDIHVPAGDLTTGRAVGAATRAAGLAVSSYGSYYRLGASSPDEGESVIHTALALGAPLIRVWAGAHASAETDAEERSAVVRDARRLAERVSVEGIRIACEWHGGTLTDTLASAMDLLVDVGNPVFGTYWQPRTRQPVAAYTDEIGAVLPHLMGVHVFQWDPQTGEKLPLAVGADDWRNYFRGLAAGDDGSRCPIYASLEFVRGDAVSQMRDDAAALRQFLSAV